MRKSVDTYCSLLPIDRLEFLSLEQISRYANLIDNATFSRMCLAGVVVAWRRLTPGHIFVTEFNEL